MTRYALKFKALVQVLFPTSTLLLVATAAAYSYILPFLDRRSKWNG